MQQAVSSLHGLKQVILSAFLWRLWYIAAVNWDAFGQFDPATGKKIYRDVSSQNETYQTATAFAGVARVSLLSTFVHLSAYLELQVASTSPVSPARTACFFWISESKCFQCLEATWLCQPLVSCLCENCTQTGQKSCIVHWGHYVKRALGKTRWTSLA